MGNTTGQTLITAQNRKQLLSNYQLYYQSNTPLQSLMQVLISACSNFTSIPLILNCFRHGQPFCGVIFLLSATCSFFYHFGEIFNCVIYLKYFEWHRLDNVFAISSFGVYAMYITGNLKQMTLMYSTLIVAILAQEKDPWNLSYTILPIVGFFVVGVVNNVYRGLGLPKYNYGMVLRGAGFLLVGIFFFEKGLDQEKDYLRINHGLWHAFLGIASYYNFHSIKIHDYDELKQ